jgi:uncharacterized membrane protein SpoIIM required for sporulation
VSQAGEFVLTLVRIAGVFGVGFLLLAPVAGLGIASWIVARQRTRTRKVVAFAMVSVLVVAAVGAYVRFRPSDQPAPEFQGDEPSFEPESS